jgi:hypothetical protein
VGPTSCPPEMAHSLADRDPVALRLPIFRRGLTRLSNQSNSGGLHRDQLRLNRTRSYFLRSIPTKFAPLASCSRSFSSNTTITDPRSWKTSSCSIAVFFPFLAPLIPLLEKRIPKRAFTESSTRHRTATAFPEERQRTASPVTCRFTGTWPQNSTWRCHRVEVRAPFSSKTKASHYLISRRPGQRPASWP